MEAAEVGVPGLDSFASLVKVCDVEGGRKDLVCAVLLDERLELRGLASRCYHGVSWFEGGVGNGETETARATCDEPNSTHAGFEDCSLPRQ